jgi:hypothetical protein
MAVAMANIYSFRAVDRVFGTAFQAGTAAGAALAAIDATLAAAHAAHLDRRYADAVRGYTDVRSLVYAQLNPGAGGSRRVALDPKLFEPLLSLSVEWMNVLPVSAPVAAVRPREEIDPALFGARPSTRWGCGRPSWPPRWPPPRPRTSAWPARWRRAATPRRPSSSGTGPPGPRPTWWPS